MILPSLNEVSDPLSYLLLILSGRRDQKDTKSAPAKSDRNHRTRSRNHSPITFNQQPSLLGGGDMTSSVVVNHHRLCSIRRKLTDIFPVSVFVALAAIRAERAPADAVVWVQKNQVAILDR
jgi:hypothetical protein